MSYSKGHQTLNKHESNHFPSASYWNTFLAYARKVKTHSTVYIILDRFGNTYLIIVVYKNIPGGPARQATPKTSVAMQTLADRKSRRLPGAGVNPGQPRQCDLGIILVCSLFQRRRLPKSEAVLSSEIPTFIVFFCVK